MDSGGLEAVDPPAVVDAKVGPPVLDVGGVDEVGPVDEVAKLLGGFEGIGSTCKNKQKYLAI